MTSKNISKTYITVIIGSALLVTISVLQSKPAFANNPSEVGGRVYMMYNGAKFPLKDVDVEKQGYCGNNPDRGTLCPACPGDDPANPACWIDRVVFYTTDNPRWSSISNGAEYRMGKYKTDTEEGPDPTFRGNITYSGNTAVCTAGVSNGWCGLNCALGPARWHASFPAGYSSANFPSGLDMKNGRWSLYLPPQGDPDWVQDWIEGDYFKLMPGNDANYQFYDFEWVPNKTCAVNLSSSSVSEGTPVTATVTGYANSGAGEPVRLWLEKSDGTPIAPTPSGADHRVYSGKHQYFLPPGCSSSTNICSSPPFTATLPAGDYRYHCDLPTDPGKCSGNPFCTYKGGAIDCAGFTSCSPDDLKSLTVTAAAGLGPLTVKEDSANGGVAGGSYGTSGLSTADGGSNYYNALSVTQNVTNSAQAALAGVAFTTRAGTYNNLSSLMSSAGSGSGNFILIYATSGCNPSCSAGGITFYPNNYYIYFNGGWNGPYQPRDVYTSSGNIKIVVDPFSVAANPKFSITFFKNFGSRSWGTYGYVMNSSNLAETVVEEQACNGTGSCY